MPDTRASAMRSPIPAVAAAVERALEETSR
jgi:hypothetical protein